MRRKLVIGVLAIAVAASPALADIFFDPMDSSAAWTVLQTADATATFGYDYSAMGIPPSPNGGGTTMGLRLTANETTGAVHEISAVADGLSLPAQYIVEFDFWVNANGPFPAGGAGSTEFAGGGVGLNDGDPGRDGASLIIAGEGGSSRDWRMYKNKGEQFIESGQYNPAMASNNSSDPFLMAAFPGQAPPQFQQDNYPQQTGTVADGTVAFGWHTMRIIVDTEAIGAGVTEDPGIARFEVDGVWIGTVDNSNGGTVVDMTGGVGVIYADLFSSVSDNAALSFGVFDNFRVIPEPAALVLLAVLAAARRR